MNQYDFPYDPHTQKQQSKESANIGCGLSVAAAIIVIGLTAIFKLLR